MHHGQSMRIERRVRVSTRANTFSAWQSRYSYRSSTSQAENMRRKVSASGSHDAVTKQDTIFGPIGIIGASGEGGIRSANKDNRAPLCCSFTRISMNNRPIVIRDIVTPLISVRDRPATTRAGLLQTHARNTRTDSSCIVSLSPLLVFTFLIIASCDRDLGYTGWTGSLLQRHSARDRKHIDVYNELFYLYFDMRIIYILLIFTCNKFNVLNLN